MSKTATTFTLPALYRHHVNPLARRTASVAITHAGSCRTVFGCVCGAEHSEAASVKVAGHGRIGLRRYQAATRPRTAAGPPVTATAWRAPLPPRSPGTSRVSSRWRHEHRPPSRPSIPRRPRPDPEMGHARRRARGVGPVLQAARWSVSAHEITLPGPPVTRAVTWEQVRAYLRAEGWYPCVGPVDGWERWGCATGSIQFGTSAMGTSRIVWELANLASVSPGEMLARIADGETLVMVGAVRSAIREQGAADMRERCAALVAARCDAPTANLIRAIPLAANDAPSMCVPGCTRRETEGAGHPGACREKV